uniref:3-dehydrosphinganine reductase n=1 Tax=Candidatus Kentrum sp. FW TaxID=2126338 RepID=A0A450S6T6_9GAMM|nr:MAG: 3-dehydrosphinganine reductase [Candidatus Kentron sp. FW]VFJ67902.1 MAG: 3-dehydrosphinganine reductase [Candidatus Kentron sp. FW]
MPRLATENLIKPFATQAIFSTAKTWDADDMAAVILKGIRRSKFSITPGWEMTLLAGLHSLIGPLLFRYFDGLARSTR